MSDIRLIRAKKIRTMDPFCPEATHVAIRDGRVLAVGGPECAQGWGDVTLDERYADAVLLPGFVEGHAHMMAGAMWRYPYVGYHDRTDPEGTLWSGLTTADAVVKRLSTCEADLAAGTPLVGWGFDPIFLADERMSRKHLDQVSPERPVAVLYSNFHLMCANSAALALVGYDQHTNIEGVIKGADGAPTGELQEIAAMFPIMRRMGIDFRALSQSPEAVASYGRIAVQTGVTTLTDLFAGMEDGDITQMLAQTSAPDYPVRLVPALAAQGGRPDEIAKRALALKARSTDRLRLGAVKLMTDGSIQGWTARVRWPGYVGGQANGIWNTAPDEIFAMTKAMQEHGVQMHIHVNGDEAAEVTLDALEAAARAHPWPAARHVLQHCQLMDRALLRRAAELGVCCNLFANHLWYFGDQHAALTIGPARAHRMNAVRTAWDEGVTCAIHSDAPVTPLAPLFTAWCAVNRQTMTGQILGEAERISVSEALYLITMGAAATLKMDTEVGSISPGKRADFAVLGEDPLSVSPDALKDVPVLGTILGGRDFVL